jgi:hypothetical protein
MQTTAPNKTGRRWRADVGDSGAAKLMNTAAKAMESAGDTRGNGPAAGVETGRCVHAAYAKLTKTLTSAKGRSACARAHRCVNGAGA